MYDLFCHNIQLVGQRNTTYICLGLPERRCQDGIRCAKDFLESREQKRQGELSDCSRGLILVKGERTRENWVRRVSD